MVGVLADAVQLWLVRYHCRGFRCDAIFHLLPFELTLWSTRVQVFGAVDSVDGPDDLASTALANSSDGARILTVLGTVVFERLPQLCAFVSFWDLHA